MNYRSFPDYFDDQVNEFFEFLVDVTGPAFESVSGVLLSVLSVSEKVLMDIHPAIWMISLGALAYYRTKKFSNTLILFLGLGFIALFGLWDKGIQSLVVVVYATLLCVIFGIPIGIFLARSKRAEWWSKPILDAMQTMPSFGLSHPYAISIWSWKSSRTSRHNCLRFSTDCSTYLARHSKCRKAIY